jgi:uncharacterized protein (TIGR02996 family)
VAHRIEAAKSGRAKCVTCEQAIAKGDTRVAEQFDDPDVPKPIHRFHHMDCALTAIPHVVAQALATPFEQDVTIDRREVEQRLLAALEAQRQRRRERYAAQLASQAAGDTPPLDELARAPLDASNDELISQLEANPDDAGVLGVLADLLQSHDEPRGELIAVQLALAGQPKDPAPLIRRRDELMLRLSPPLEIGERCAWGIGFVRRVKLVIRNGDRLAVLPVLWRHPSMRLVTEIEVELDGRYEAELGTVLAPIRANLRRLVVTTTSRLGALSALVATLPRLRQLAIPDDADFDRLAHPDLERLILNGRRYGETGLVEVIPRLSMRALPALCELGVRGTSVRTDAVCEALAATAWLPRLTKLDLVDGQLGEPGITALARGLAGHKLALLDVTGNPMPLTLRGALAELCDELVFPNQLDPEGTVYVEHANKPEWGTGTLIRRYDGKLEVDFPHVGKKVFKANAPFLKLRA